MTDQYIVGLCWEYILRCYYKLSHIILQICEYYLRATHKNMSSYRLKIRILFMVVLYVLLSKIMKDQV